LKEAGLGQKNARLACRRLLVIPQIALFLMALVALVSAGLLEGRRRRTSRCRLSRAATVTGMRVFIFMVFN
jgi:hypothetical protein